MFRCQDYSLRWTQIRALAESQSFWSLNILLIVVPFLASLIRINFPGKEELLNTLGKNQLFNIPTEILFLYIASILVTISTLLYFIFRPGIVTFSGSNEFKELGKTDTELADEYKACGFEIDKIDDSHVKTKLKNKNYSSEVDNISFWYVHRQLNDSRFLQRAIITFLYLIAFFILLGVNVYRFAKVITVVLPQ